MRGGHSPSRSRPVLRTGGEHELSTHRVPRTRRPVDRGSRSTSARSAPPRSRSRSPAAATTPCRWPRRSATTRRRCSAAGRIEDSGPPLDELASLLPEAAGDSTMAMLLDCARGDRASAEGDWPLATAQLCAQRARRRTEHNDPGQMCWDLMGMVLAAAGMGRHELDARAARARTRADGADGHTDRPFRRVGSARGRGGGLRAGRARAGGGRRGRGARDRAAAASSSGNGSPSWQPDLR